MIGFLLFLFAVAVIGITSLGVMQLSTRPKLASQVHDKEGTEPEKLSQAKLYEQKNSLGAVTFGKCTKTLQEVWQTMIIRVMNTLFIGPNGVGKTSHILSTSLKQDIESGDNAVVWFEGKCDKRTIGVIADLCRKAKRELVVFPYDKGYNPLNIGETPKARAAMFSSMIRQAREGVSKDAEHFTGEMVKFVDLIVPVFEYVKRRPMIPEELKILCNNKQKRNDLLDQAKGSREYKNYKNTYGDSEDKDFQIVLKGISTIIGNLYEEKKDEGRFYLYNTREAKGGISDAIDRKAVIIFAEGGNMGSAEHDRGMIYLAELMGYARSRMTNHLVCLYMDELHYYLTPSFTQFQATSRSANFVQVLGFQTFGMLKTLSKEAAQSIMTNCRTWIVHTGLDYEDAVIVSQKTTERPHVTFSESRNMNSITEKGTQGRHLENMFLIPPYKIQTMNSKHVLYLSLNDDRSIAPPRYLIKPPVLDDNKSWSPPEYTPLDILTVWEEEDELALQNGQPGNQSSNNQQTSGGNSNSGNATKQHQNNQSNGKNSNNKPKKKGKQSHAGVQKQSTGNNGLPNVGSI